MIRRVIKTGKAVGKGAVKTARYAAPFSPNTERQIGLALKMPEIRKAYKEFAGDPREFIDSLRRYIEIENSQNYVMRKLAGTIDTANKALVPVDAFLDYMAFFGGVGTGAKAIGTLAKMPAYLAYDAYYLAKTGDFVGTLGNAVYELGSWFLPGSLPHLLNRYSKQADKYSVREASEDFLKGLERIGCSEFEKKKQQKTGAKKSKNLEELARAA